MSSCYLFVCLLTFLVTWTMHQSGHNLCPSELLLFERRHCSRFDTSCNQIHHPVCHWSSVIANENRTLLNKDGCGVRQKAKIIQFVVLNNILIFQFQKVLLKADHILYHFCYALQCFSKGRLLRSLPATSKPLNKLISGQIVNPVCLLHSVVCCGVVGKRLTWRQMLFGLCKCWSSLRGELEDKMINVRQWAQENVHNVHSIPYTEVFLALRCLQRAKPCQTARFANPQWLLSEKS